MSTHTASSATPFHERHDQNLKDRDLVPPPVMTHPNRWRLDQLLTWEERRMASAEAALVAPDREPTAITELLPQPKRRRHTE